MQQKDKNPVNARSPFSGSGIEGKKIMNGRRSWISTVQEFSDMFILRSAVMKVTAPKSTVQNYYFLPSFPDPATIPD